MSSTTPQTFLVAIAIDTFNENTLKFFRSRLGERVVVGLISPITGDARAANFKHDPTEERAMETV